MWFTRRKTTKLEGLELDQHQEQIRGFRNLYLSQCASLSVAPLTAILDILKHAIADKVVFSELNLSGLKLNDADFLPLVEPLKNDQCIKILNLKSNHLTDLGAQSLLRILNSPSSCLTKLSLNGNQITHQAGALVQAAADHPTLLSLNLEKNPVEKKHARKFVFTKPSLTTKHPQTPSVPVTTVVPPVILSATVYENTPAITSPAISSTVTANSTHQGSGSNSPSSSSPSSSMSPRAKSPFPAPPPWKASQGTTGAGAFEESTLANVVTSSEIHAVSQVLSPSGDVRLSFGQVAARPIVTSSRVAYGDLTSDSTREQQEVDEHTYADEHGGSDLEPTFDLERNDSNQQHLQHKPKDGTTWKAVLRTQFDKVDESGSGVVHKARLIHRFRLVPLPALLKSEDPSKSDISLSDMVSALNGCPTDVTFQCAVDAVENRLSRSTSPPKKQNSAHTDIHTDQRFATSPQRFHSPQRSQSLNVKELSVTDTTSPPLEAAPVSPSLLRLGSRSKMLERNINSATSQLLFSAESEVGGAPFNRSGVSSALLVTEPSSVKLNPPASSFADTVSASVSVSASASASALGSGSAPLGLPVSAGGAAGGGAKTDSRLHSSGETDYSPVRPGPLLKSKQPLKAAAARESAESTHHRTAAGSPRAMASSDVDQQSGQFNQLKDFLFGGKVKHTSPSASNRLEPEQAFESSPEDEHHGDQSQQSEDSVIEEGILLNDDGSISKVASVLHLARQGHDFREIPMLKFFTNLKELYLSHNAISSIDNLPVSIEVLDLSYNRIHSMEGLENLHRLECLKLNHNNIRGITHLTMCKSLKELHIAHNQLRGMRNLSHLQGIRFLDISQNSIASFEHCSILSLNRKLQVLLCRDNPMCHASTYRNNLRSVLPHILVIDPDDSARFLVPGIPTLFFVGRRGVPVRSTIDATGKETWEEVPADQQGSSNGETGVDKFPLFRVPPSPILFHRHSGPVLPPQPTPVGGISGNTSAVISTAKASPVRVRPSSAPRTRTAEASHVSPQRSPGRPRQTQQTQSTALQSQQQQQQQQQQQNPQQQQRVVSQTSNQGLMRVGSSPVIGNGKHKQHSAASPVRSLPSSDTSAHTSSSSRSLMAESSPNGLLSSSVTVVKKDEIMAVQRSLSAGRSGMMSSPRTGPVAAMMIAPAGQQNMHTTPQRSVTSSAAATTSGVSVGPQSVVMSVNLRGDKRSNSPVRARHFAAMESNQVVNMNRPTSDSSPTVSVTKSLNGHYLESQNSLSSNPSSRRSSASRSRPQSASSSSGRRPAPMPTSTGTMTPQRQSVSGSVSASVSVSGSTTRRMTPTRRAPSPSPSHTGHTARVSHNVNSENRGFFQTRAASPFKVGSYRLPAPAPAHQPSPVLSIDLSTAKTVRSSPETVDANSAREEYYYVEQSADFADFEPSHTMVAADNDELQSAYMDARFNNGRSKQTVPQAPVQRSLGSGYRH